MTCSEAAAGSVPRTSRPGTGGGPGLCRGERVGTNVACRTEGRARTEGWARSARPVGAVRALPVLTHGRQAE